MACWTWPPPAKRRRSTNREERRSTRTRRSRPSRPAASTASRRTCSPPFTRPASAPAKAAARAAAADISSGYGLISAQLTRRLFRACTVLNQRRATLAAMMLVSVAEAAALAGLPAEPAAYGLPTAASRRRGPGRDTWAAPTHTAGGYTRPAPITRGAPDFDTDPASGDDTEPSLWSIP